MKKICVLLLLLSTYIGFSCQRKPYPSFQNVPLSKEVATGNPVLSEISPLPIPQSSSFSAGVTPLVLPELTGLAVLNHKPAKAPEQKSTFFKQYRKIMATRKAWKRSQEKQSNAGKSKEEYKSLGIISLIMGLLATFSVVIGIVSVSALGTGLLIGGILGAIALTAGIVSVGKLSKGEKVPSIIGIVTGSIGVVFGLFVLVFLLLWSIG
jgi:hypothetical protein